MNKGFLLITLALASGCRDSSVNTAKLYPGYMQRKIIFWYVKNLGGKCSKPCIVTWSYESLDVKRHSCGSSPKHSFESIPLADHLQAVMRLTDKNAFVGTDLEETPFQGRCCILKVWLCGTQHYYNRFFFQAT